MAGKLGQGKGQVDGRQTSPKRFRAQKNPKPSRGGHNDEVIIEHRRVRVSELQRKGYNQLDIVRILGEEGTVISQSTICNDVKALLKEYREISGHNTEESRNRQLDNIAYLKQRAWDEFEFSRVNRVTVKPSKTDKDQRVRVIEERKEGNPQWAVIIKSCEELEAKIKGLFNETVVNNDNRSVTIDWSNMSVGDDPIQARIDAVKVLGAQVDDAEVLETKDVGDVKTNN